MENAPYFKFLLLMGLRYFIMTGLAFLLFYVLFRNKFARLKIQRMFPKNKDYYREIKYSCLTLVIFSAYAVLVFRSPLTAYTKLYQDISQFGLAYFFGSVMLAILIHDTYFYWTHRLMHHPKLFRYIHLIHHKSHNPSPWAAYSFHPLEALIEGGVILVVVFLIPMHRGAVGLFMLAMFSFNVYGHLGYEILPKKFYRSRLGRIFNTGTNHNDHHHGVRGNFGLYFRFWDCVMHTEKEPTLKTDRQ
ncbi:sterol desaturase family protein [Flavobacterium silvaticum]|uniref:Sterol desaturase family protein n=1 Tax=Flavobacterium silvaticum TaxID=1852020 RepID=A0A972FTN0_9FLAO|nr:sterol desaturase family protein [Flavobacterium silvaticum]NMH27802.1 sterol desaturase family protein [Flavobacterium silvaticum]